MSATYGLQGLLEGTRLSQLALAAKARFQPHLGRLFSLQRMSAIRPLVEFAALQTNGSSSEKSLNGYFAPSRKRRLDAQSLNLLTSYVETEGSDIRNAVRSLIRTVIDHELASNSDDDAGIGDDQL